MTMLVFKTPLNINQPTPYIVHGFVCSYPGCHKILVRILLHLYVFGIINNPGICHCHAIISCFIKIQNGSAFLVLAYPSCHGKRLLNGCSSSSFFSFFFLPYLSLTFQNRPTLFPAVCHRKQLNLFFSLLCLFCIIVFLCSCCIVNCVITDLVIMLA